MCYFNIIYNFNCRLESKTIHSKSRTESDNKNMLLCVTLYIAKYLNDFFRFSVLAILRFIYLFLEILFHHSLAFYLFHSNIFAATVLRLHWIDGGQKSYLYNFNIISNNWDYLQFFLIVQLGYVFIFIIM